MLLVRTSDVQSAEVSSWESSSEPQYEEMVLDGVACYELFRFIVKLTGDVLHCDRTSAVSEQKSL